MTEIKLLEINDIKRIFGISQVSVYRWVSASRAGTSRFPLPIGGSKQKLRWNAGDIEAYCQSSNGATMPVAVKTLKQPKREKQTLQQRQEATRTALARHGIVINLNQRGE
jgi:predicted DNA-binding transcriptional regulator AlpA